MRWVRIEDNEQSWELLLTGLLWFGDENGGNMCRYNTKEWVHISKKQWMETSFIGGCEAALPNYIRVED